jgi:hypothetical protein
MHSAIASPCRSYVPETGSVGASVTSGSPDTKTRDDVDLALPVLEYPGHFVVKKITTGRTFRFHYKLLYLANSLVNQHIGMEETDDGVWSIYFNTVLIATLNERDYIIRG